MKQERKSLVGLVQRFWKAPDRDQEAFMGEIPAQEKT